MIHPLAGIIWPEHISVVGPVTRDGSPSRHIWQRLREANVRSSGIDVSAVNRSPGIYSSWDQLGERPDLVFLSGADPRQSLVDLTYRGIPLAVDLDHSNQKSGDAAATWLMSADRFGYARPGKQVFVGDVPEVQPGNVAMITTSGLVGQAMIETMSTDRPAALSLYVTISPNSHIRIAELLSLVAQDESSDVISLYLDPPYVDREFLTTMSRVSSQKPVVLLTPAQSGTAADMSLFASQHGAIVVRSLAEMRKMVLALAAPLHPAHRRIVRFSPDGNLDWRRASALRRLSGVRDNYWMAMAGLSGAESFDHWRQVTNSPTVRITPSHQARPDNPAWPVLRPSGLVAALADHCACPTHDKLEAWPADYKQSMRNLLHQIPSDFDAPLPYCYDLLAGAGIQVGQGCWISSVDGAMEATRQLGWPIKVWGLDESTVHCSRTFNDAGPLRSYVRRAMRDHAQLWVQRTGTVGLDFTISVERDPVVGPIVSVHPGGIFTGRRPARLLPANRRQAGYWLASEDTMKTLSTLGDGDLALSGITESIESVSRLVLELPEIVNLELHMVVGNGGALVESASIRWSWEYEVAP